MPELARMLRKAARGAQLPAHDSVVRRIRSQEAGEHEISERYELLYAQAFGLPVEVLALGPDGRPAPDHDGTAGVISRTLDELAAQSVEFGRQAEAATVGARTIEQLDDGIQRLSREYLASPPLPVIRRAAAIRSQVYALIGERQRLRYARDLYVVAAKCCAFLSWAASDLGNLAAATAEGRTGLLLAEESGHPGAQAVALCALSKAAFWEGRYSQAARLARQGFECCPPNTTRALLGCQEADALQTTQAGEAIARSRRAQDDACADDDLGGVFSAGRVRVANYAAGVSLKAGDPSAVLAAAGAAPAATGEQVGYGTAAQLSISAAIAALQMRQLDEAEQQLAPVLALPAGQRLATLTERLSALVPPLTTGTYRSAPAATALAGQIISYCEAGTQALALLPGEDVDGT